ncbi:MAG: radical SAM protein [bacterium]|nr:MAG: radical SAM protein [bacterium]
MQRQPTIEWQTNGICNYDCSYCVQSKKFRQGHPSDEEIEKFLVFFARLPGIWEIKMSGGEPFAFKGFMDKIIPGLAKLPHNISILTNLSAPLSILDKLVTLVGDKLSVVSVSLHLEYVEATEFIDKVKQLRQWLRPETSLVINSVLVPNTLENLLVIKELVESYSLKYFPQVMKTKHGVFPYTESDKDLVVQLTGKNPSPKEANLAPSYRGLLCWSGAEYFVLDQKGHAWACRTAKRFQEGYLGNVLANTFELKSIPMPCQYDICPCTVPANRGMIEGIKINHEG